MNEPYDLQDSTANESISPTQSNTVSLIGFVLALITAVMCGWMALAASAIPDKIDAFSRVQGNAPAQLRLLILACSTAVLNAVAFILCCVGLFLPRRPRTLAVVGTAISFLLLVAVFGVLTVGITMNPESTSQGGPQMHSDTDSKSTKRTATPQ